MEQRGYGHAVTDNVHKSQNQGGDLLAPSGCAKSLN